MAISERVFGKNGKAKDAQYALEAVKEYNLYFSTPLPLAQHKQAVDLLAKNFECATIFHTRGIWQGSSEHSSVIRVIVPAHKVAETEAFIEVVVLALITAYAQEAVYVTVEDKHATLMTRNQFFPIKA